MSFNTFEDVISYMEKKSLGSDMHNDKLLRMHQILDKLGNPQNCYKTLHVAGSKGKGSTSSYLAAGLRALGFSTGLYLSPHVSDYRERFTVNGKFAPDRQLIETGNELEEALKDLPFHPTTFELYTAFAFLLFKKSKCTWAVIETGLGGRLDATNVLLPQASILTPIELEHTDILGNTIAEIAGEKAKIIKPNTPSFMSFQKPEAQNVFEKEAFEKNSKLTKLQNELISFENETTKEYEALKLEFKDGFKADLKLKMVGNVQAYNCALALCTLRSLGLYKEGITEKALEENILPGRMEKVNWKRPVFIDGAHTENSIGNLVKSFKEIYPEQDPICIFGCLAGKNAEAMGHAILASFKTVVICKPGEYKKSNPKELYDLFNSLKSKDQSVYLFENAKDALDFCLKNTKENTPILVCGSFYLAGAIKEALCL